MSATSEVFRAFLVLGLTSFGGPIAHLGYFHREFVDKRKWLDAHAYAELVALCQFLPGPASSQVGMALGNGRAGLPGALAAWLGFTLPSAIALVLFATSLTAINERVGVEWLHGLKVVAVAVVAQALWAMARSLTPDILRVAIALVAAVVATLWPSTMGQVAALAIAAVAGRFRVSPMLAASGAPIPNSIGRSLAAIFFALFVLLLIGLPVVAVLSDNYAVQLVDSFYRAGALVFGGGHVVLPLLQAEVVPRGWIGNDEFLAGYGLAQAVPGPLFTFAAFLGAASSQSPAGWVGAGIAVLAIFLPGFLLVVGTLPFWERVRRYESMRRAIAGVNAAVVGLLLAAFYHPVWTSAILSLVDFALAVLAFVALTWWRLPPWLVVLAAAIVTGIGVG